MKNSWTIVLTVLALVAPALAQPEPGAGRPERPDRPEPRGPGGGFGTPTETARQLAEVLNLTDAQRPKYDALAEKFRPEWDRQGAEREQMAQQMRAARESGNTAQADELRQKMDQLRERNRSLINQFFEEVAAILTPEQIEKRNDFRAQLERRRPGPGRPPEEASTPLSDTPPLAKDETEKKILDVLSDLEQNQRRGMMNVPAEDGRLLRLLAEAVGAKHVVEIGTSNGYSGIWLCLALRTTGGRLTTYEIDAERARLARENFKHAGVDQMVTLVEGDAHEEVTKLKEPIDLLFLDADKEGYADYLRKLLPLVRGGGLIVGHNINPHQADPAYLKATTTDPLLETLLLHQEGAGVSVTLKKR